MKINFPAPVFSKPTLNSFPKPKEACECECLDEVLAEVTDLMEDIDEVLAEITEERCK